MQRVEIVGTTIARCELSHDETLSRRERERQAVARLLRELLGEGVKVEHRPSGAPYLPGHELFVSISHSARHAVVALNPTCPVGVDAETLRPQLERVKEKFLSADEILRFTSLPQLLRSWCIKEAAYKAAGIEGLPLVEGIVIGEDGHVEVVNPCDGSVALYDQTTVWDDGDELTILIVPKR